VISQYIDPLFSMQTVFPAGGGGSFVALGASLSTATPLIVAGGGGAGARSSG
jgi:hypothetical protein